MCLCVYVLCVLCLCVCVYPLKIIWKKKSKRIKKICFLQRETLIQTQNYCVFLCISYVNDSRYLAYFHSIPLEIYAIELLLFHIWGLIRNIDFRDINWIFVVQPNKCEHRSVARWNSIQWHTHTAWENENKLEENAVG